MTWRSSIKPFETEVDSTDPIWFILLWSSPPSSILTNWRSSIKLMTMGHEYTFSHLYFFFCSCRVLSIRRIDARSLFLASSAMRRHQAACDWRTWGNFLIMWFLIDFFLGLFPAWRIDARGHQAVFCGGGTWGVEIRHPLWSLRHPHNHSGLCVWGYMCARVCVQIHIYTHICKHMYTYIHTCIYT